MYDPLASAVNADAADEQSGWADDCELDSQGKVITGHLDVDYKRCSRLR